MKKSLDLQVDRASWNAVPPAFQKPCPFWVGQSRIDVDFLGALLWAGITSVSVRMPRWWLASQWALLRYVAAADHGTSRLRLHEAADDLDTHHKKVLSDDWGIGLSLQWLTARLRYKFVAHGMFAMQDLQDRRVASFVGRRRSGPFKCPDFFAVDAQNKIHLIECKGNQQGPENILVQFERGRQQKQNVRFRTEALVGQRLLTGIAIAGANSDWSSTVRVADPPPDDRVSFYEINSDSEGPIIESIRKVVAIEGLMLAGSFRTAHLVFPRETQTEDLPTIVGQRVSLFTARDAIWEGQIYELLFPMPIRLLDGTSIAACRLRCGVSQNLIERLQSQARTEQREEVLHSVDLDLTLDSEDDVEFREGGKGHQDAPGTERIGRYAAIQRGNSFIADLELLEA